MDRAGRKRGRDKLGTVGTAESSTGDHSSRPSMISMPQTDSQFQKRARIDGPGEGSSQGATAAQRAAQAAARAAIAAAEAVRRHGTYQPAVDAFASSEDEDNETDEAIQALLGSRRAKPKPRTKRNSYTAAKRRGPSESSRRRRSYVDMDDEDDYMPDYDSGSDTGGKSGRSKGKSKAKSSARASKSSLNSSSVAAQSRGRRGSKRAPASKSRTGKAGRRGQTGAAPFPTAELPMPTPEETGAAALAEAAKAASQRMVLRSTRPLAVTPKGLRQFVEHPETGVRLYLQNTISTFSLGCTPDLVHVASRVRNAEYNPRRFAAVIIRLKEPRCSGLVFASGKCVIAGAKNEEESNYAARKIAGLLKLVGCDVHFRGFQVQNMVGSGDFGFPVRLEAVADSNYLQCTYEPELFPGLIYRMAGAPHAVATIFVSGKVNITSIKSRTELLHAFGVVHAIVFPHRKVPLGMAELPSGQLVVAAAPAAEPPALAGGGRWKKSAASSSSKAARMLPAPAQRGKGWGLPTGTAAGSLQAASHGGTAGSSSSREYVGSAGSGGATMSSSAGALNGGLDEEYDPLAAMLGLNDDDDDDDDRAGGGRNRGSDGRANAETYREEDGGGSTVGGASRAASGAGGTGAGGLGGSVAAGLLGMDDGGEDEDEDDDLLAGLR